jgi:glycosyltransferase involved in cell wall biosynthesis
MSAAPASSPRRRRILLLTYYYPPDTAVGAVRPSRLAAALRERGHHVHVIAAGETDAFDDAAGVDRTRPLPNPREWWLRIKRLKRDRSIPTSSTAAELHAAGGYSAPPNPGTLKRWVLSVLWTPDDRQGFIWPAVRRALQAAEREPFDLIYSSAPPFSVHLAGLLLKQRLGVPWIAEFRDPWLDSAGKGAHVRSRLMYAAEARMERACLEAADEVVTVTHSAARAIGAKRATVGRSTPHVVLSGIESAPTPQPARAPGPTRVLYLGTLYHGRDPRPLFDALARLRQEGRLPHGTVDVRFVGACRWFHGLPVQELSSHSGIADVVSLHDPVPPSQAQSLLHEADVLLLLAQRQPTQVPHKLYEYLGAGRPILAFADEHGETTRMLRHVGGHQVVTEATPADETAERVAAALQSPSVGWTMDPMKLEEWSTTRQMANAIRLIEALT